TLPNGGGQPTAVVRSFTTTQGSCSQGVGQVTCNLGTFNNGATATVIIQTTINGTGTANASATVAANESDPNGANNTQGVSTTVQAGVCVSPPTNLVAWYPGDGNAFDIQGGNHGTLQNGATTASGRVGQAFSFDGVDDQVVVPHNQNQNTGSQITIDAWINPSSSGQGRPIAQKLSASNVGGYTFETTHAPSGPDNGLAFVVWIGGTPRTLQTGPNVLTIGAWQHVAATYDGTLMRIFVNGAERSNRLQSGAIDAVTDPLVIGRNVVTPSFACQGLID